MICCWKRESKAKAKEDTASQDHLSMKTGLIHVISIASNDINDKSLKTM